MKNYLLTAVGNFESEEMSRDFAMSFTPIVDSPNLKFLHSHSVLMLHFASEVPKDEIFDYTMGIFFGITETFILTELHDKMTVNLPEKMKDYLLNLEDDSDNPTTLDMSKIKSNYGFNDIEEEDDFVALLLDNTQWALKRPSLDQILDKISSKGYESLTQFEKDSLELYSKK